jgi:hypothetical protein
VKRRVALLLMTKAESSSIHGWHHVWLRRNDLSRSSAIKHGIDRCKYRGIPPKISLEPTSTRGGLAPSNGKGNGWKAPLQRNGPTGSPDGSCGNDGTRGRRRKVKYLPPLERDGETKRVEWVGVDTFSERAAGATTCLSARLVRVEGWVGLQRAHVRPRRRSIARF